MCALGRKSGGHLLDSGSTRQRGVAPLPVLPRRSSVRDALQLLIEALDSLCEVLRREIDRHGQAPQDADRGLLARRFDQGDVRPVDARRAGDVFLGQPQLVPALLEGRGKGPQEYRVGAGSHARHYFQNVA